MVGYASVYNANYVMGPRHVDDESCCKYSMFISNFQIKLIVAKVRSEQAHELGMIMCVGLILILGFQFVSILVATYLLRIYYGFDWSFYLLIWAGWESFEFLLMVFITCKWFMCRIYNSTLNIKTIDSTKDKEENELDAFEVALNYDYEAEAQFSDDINKKEEEKKKKEREDDEFEKNESKKREEEEKKKQKEKQRLAKIEHMNKLRENKRKKRQELREESDKQRSDSKLESKKSETKEGNKSSNGYESNSSTKSDKSKSRYSKNSKERRSKKKIDDDDHEAENSSLLNDDEKKSTDQKVGNLPIVSDDDDDESSGSDNVDD